MIRKVTKTYKRTVKTDVFRSFAIANQAERCIYIYIYTSMKIICCRLTVTKIIYIKNPLFFSSHFRKLPTWQLSGSLGQPAWLHHHQLQCLCRTLPETHKNTTALSRNLHQSSFRILFAKTRRRKGDKQSQENSVVLSNKQRTASRSNTSWSWHCYYHCSSFKFKLIV